MMITDTDTDVTHKTVPAAFDKKGFHYEQLRRTGNVAIYRQTRKGSEFSNYEVVKIGHHNGYSMGGAYIAPAETYPGASLWGICGWTCTTLDAANMRFQQLCES